MRDIKAKIERTLRTIPDVTVSFFYPQSFNTLPAVSFYEIANTTAFTMDNSEYATESNIQIDVWAKEPYTAQQIADKAIKKMKRIGFTREFARDLYEPETQLHHRTMRFAGYIIKGD